MATTNTKSTPTTVRLDVATLAILDDLTRTRGVSRAEVIREAIKHLATLDSENTPDRALWDRIGDLIASSAGDGPEDLADTRRERVAELIRAKHER